MRILLFTQQLASSRSGVGTYARCLTRALADRGHGVTVCGPAEEATTMDGVRWVSAPRSRRDPTPGGWFTLGLAFARALRREAADHEVALFADAREAWALRRFPIPSVGAVHDAYALEWLAEGYPRGVFADRGSRTLYYAFLRSVERRTYRRLSALAANSRHVAEAAASGYGLAPEKVAVVPLGLPVREPAPRIPLEGAPALLFVGGNFQRKGLPVLLAAAAELARARPGVRVHVVGRDRNQPAMESLARALGVAANVVFHGWQPNDRVRGMMAGADAFVLPSLTEGFGLAYAEAMEAGTPVVATAAGGAREFFVDGKEAVFVQPGDAAGLARVLERLVSDPAGAARLADAGRRALARLTVEAMAAGTETVLRKAAGR